MALRLFNFTAGSIASARPWTVASLTSVRTQAKMELVDEKHVSQQNFEDCLSVTEAQKVLAQLKEEALARIMLDPVVANVFHVNNSRRMSSSSILTVQHQLDSDTIEEGMGSITSVPKVRGEDDQDADLEFTTSTPPALLERCQQELQNLPRPFDRQFRRMSSQHTFNDNSGKPIHDEKIRVFQWNQLSQTLGTKNDNFVLASPAALDWTTRRWRLLEEIVRYSPDVICLQEVDHIKLFEKALGSIGYSGHFVAKPDSPCIYLPSNNGPDGCAIFYKQNKFDMVTEPASRVVEVWRVQSNQVVLSINLRHRQTGREVCVATTHLKARSGALLSTLRNEQGKDILEWLETVKSDNTPLILCGDFNAEPSEPVYKTMTENNKTPLQSAYKIREEHSRGMEENEEDLEFTTWKVRETGEQKHILDYIFHSSDSLTTVSTLDMPSEEQVGESRLPSPAFASDHLSMVADLTFSE